LAGISDDRFVLTDTNLVAAQDVVLAFAENGKTLTMTIAGRNH
jgi:hypothetical protein